MATVQAVTTLNIDGTAFNVSDLSDKVQGLVSVYNEWNQEAANAQSKLGMVQAALNDLSRQIIMQVKADQDAAAAAAVAANDASVVADAAPATDATPAAVADVTAKE